MSLRVAIVGAGIIGITSACRIIDQFPNSQVTVIADKFSPDTTSDVSAGYWEPYCLDESSDQAKLILKWGKETYDVMMNIAKSEFANKYGVQSLCAFVIQDRNHEKVPYWAKIVSHFRVLEKDEINNLIANNQESKFAKGFQFLTTTCVVNRFISVLTEERYLIKFVREESEKYDYIVNCTGMGAREFVPDPNSFPTKGQVLRVKAPWIKNCLMLESDEIVYALPLIDTVVIGGSQEENIYDLSTNSCDEILARCQKYFPSLKSAEVVSKHSGLRPSRKGGIRLEMEKYGTAKVIHNYGHGGSGVTLCWGCATNVSEIIKNERHNSKSKL